jgi:hypothetical protein
MYRRWVQIVILLIIEVAGAGCSVGPPPLPVQIELTGTPGAEVAGYYIQNGRRIDLRGKLPLTLFDTGITQIAVRKVNKEDNLVSTVRVGKDLRGGVMSTSSRAGDPNGIRLITEDGSLSGTIITPEESLDSQNNALFVIAPYWYEGTWVFDDPHTGLTREPFVQGIPDMINELVKNIPDARRGFRLTASTKPFPGYSKKMLWVKAEDGGNVYRIEDPPLQGWLCPAMFRYFATTPKEIFVKAEPKN